MTYKEFKNKVEKDIKAHSAHLKFSVGTHCKRCLSSDEQGNGPCFYRVLTHLQHPTAEQVLQAYELFKLGLWKASELEIGTAQSVREWIQKINLKE